jgi:hypothetical protein
MRSDLNLAVQLGVVALCGLLRLLTPGWPRAHSAPRW